LAFDLYLVANCVHLFYISAYLIHNEKFLVCSFGSKILIGFMLLVMLIFSVNNRIEIILTKYISKGNIIDLTNSEERGRYQRT
jgi:hypothetical protein